MREVGQLLPLRILKRSEALADRKMKDLIDRF